MDAPDKVNFYWSWYEEYQTFSFEDNKKVSIPLYLNDGLKKVDIPAEKRIELATSFIGLREAIKESFGVKQVSIYGPVAGYPRADSTSGFFLHSSNISRMLLECAMIDFGKDLDRYDLRLNTGEISDRLFTVESSTGNVYNFSKSPSTLTGGAKRVGGQVLEKFNSSVKNNGSKHFVSIDDMFLILREMKNQTVEEFELSDIEATDKNMKNYLNLLNFKEFEVFKDVIKKMPYLQVNEKVEQNILHMISMGLTYEKMYAISVLGIYPKDEEELKTLMNLPYKWMIKAFLV